MATRITTWDKKAVLDGTEAIAIDDGGNKYITPDELLEYGLSFLSFGSIYFSSTATTTLSAATPAKAAGTTTTQVLNIVTHPTDNRLTNDGTGTHPFKVLFTGGVTKAAAGSSQAQFHLYKNGVLITGSTVGRTIPSASDEGAFSVHCIVSLAPGDYVELWLETDDGDDLVIEDGVLSMQEL